MCAKSGLSGRGEHLGAYDFALDLFVFPGLELGLVAVELDADGGTDDEVGGVHGFFGVCAAGVGLALRFEEEIVDLVLIVLGLHAGGLDLFEGGVGLELVGKGWKREAKDRD